VWLSGYRVCTSAKARLRSRIWPTANRSGRIPQCLANQVGQADPSRTVDVRRSGLEPDDVRQRRAQLGGFFDQHDAFRRIRGCEQGAENGVLPTRQR
jgi:hypothetical protein